MSEKRCRTYEALAIALPEYTPDGAILGNLCRQEAHGDPPRYAPIRQLRQQLDSTASTTRSFLYLVVVAAILVTAACLYIKQSEAQRYLPARS